MLGTTGGRFLGPSGSHPHRNLWPPARALEFQTNGEGKQIFIHIESSSKRVTHNYFMYV